MVLFNLYGADVSTDGKWCYLVFWVFGKPSTRWGLLKTRLSGACPSCSSASGISFYQTESQPPNPPDVFLLKLSCLDRKGLLHGKLTFNLYFLIAEHELVFVLLILNFGIYSDSTRF